MVKSGVKHGEEVGLDMPHGPGYIHLHMNLGVAT